MEWKPHTSRKLSTAILNLKMFYTTDRQKRS